MQSADSAVSLDDILITPLLTDRSAPSRDIAAEHEGLTDLIGQTAADRSRLLPRLVDLALQLCDAGTAGVSLIEPGTEPETGVFRWVAMAGAYRQHVGNTTPQAFSPCGVCLARGTAQLYRYPARLFTYLSLASPPIVESLVLPLYSDSKPLGTLWIVSHDEARGFTAREVAVLRALADFTSTALALQRAREEAETANRAKDEFLAVVSHELRRPLTAIVGWSELLLAGRASPATAARAIEALYSNARRQQNLTEDLLDASRSLTGTLRLNERTMDLGAVVRAAIEIIADSAEEKSIDLVAEVKDSLPLRGDPERLHQVVGNLLSNAVKFTPVGGRVYIATKLALPWVEISVRDTGIGIEPHMVPLVFDPFRKANASSTRRDSGLGLGLTIARRIAELHEGTIEAHSDGEGRGSLFTVRLPAARLVAESELGAQAALAAQRSVQLAGVTILVVDDEPDVRDILAWMLQDAGATVATASDVDEALSTISRQSIDVLITDLVMPERDGYDLLARIEQNTSPRRPHATIAVTALASARERRRALDAGFDHHLAKPIDFNALVQMITASATSQEGH